MYKKIIHSDQVGIVLGMQVGLTFKNQSVWYTTLIKQRLGSMWSNFDKIQHLCTIKHSTEGGSFPQSDEGHLS